MSLSGVINFGFIYFPLRELHLMFKKKSTQSLSRLCSLKTYSASLLCSSIFFQMHFLNSLQVWLCCPSFPLFHCPGSLFPHEFWHFLLGTHTLWNFSCGNFLMPYLQLCFFGENFNLLLTGTLGCHKPVPCVALEAERLNDCSVQHLPSAEELASVLTDLYEFTFLLQFWTSRIFFVLMPTQWCVE